MFTNLFYNLKTILDPIASVYWWGKHPEQSQYGFLVVKKIDRLF
jgi:hypothetical protein